MIGLQLNLWEQEALSAIVETSDSALATTVDTLTYSDV